METRELLSTFNKLLTEQFGPIVRTKYLGGVAGEGCTRVCFENKSVIVKMSSQSRERMFYEKHAGVLRLHGVAIAELYVSGCNANGVHYIVIEDIPHPLPQDQWTRNIRQVEILFALHHATWGDRKPVVEEPFRPEWTDEMTNRVFDWFARHIDADEILTRLKQAQTLWHQVDLEHCCVSADPNPTNWRVRDDGTLVLVDWERFGYGTPAIDLAILIPGLGSPDGELEKWLASSYVELWRMCHRMYSMMT